MTHLLICQNEQMVMSLSQSEGKLPSKQLNLNTLLKDRYIRLNIYLSITRKKQQHFVIQLLLEFSSVHKILYHKKSLIELNVFSEADFEPSGIKLQELK